MFATTVLFPFQSHFGSIKTLILALYAEDTYIRFNPTLVRLKPCRSPARPIAAECFNPTLVRLKPFRWANGKDVTYSFNPTLVRLKRELREALAA